MTREEFFNKKNAGALWDVGVSINRTNPLPLDKNAVFEDYDKALTYAKGVLAYPGQFIAVVGTESVDGYLITVAGSENANLIKLAATTVSGDIANDVAALQTQVADLVTKVGKAAVGEEAATGLYKEIADVLAVANEKVANVGAADGTINILGEDAQHPTLKVAISDDEDNALTLAPNGLKVIVPEVAHPEYSVVKDTDSGEYSAVYHLTKGGANVGVPINIPKDLVIESGSVHTYEAGALPADVTEPGTYIVLVLANATNDKLYIKVDDLIEYVTSGSKTGDMIFVNVDPLSHEVTATITDGTITKAKLTAAIQASLDKADSAIQSVVESATNGNITVDGAEVKVHGLADAAYTTVASLNADAKSYADAATEAVVGTDADTADSLTIYGARAYADAAAKTAEDVAKFAASDAIAALDVTDEAKTGEFVTAVSETDGKISVSRKALIASDIPEIGMSKVTGLQDALDAKQDPVIFDGEYSATNKAATVGTVNAAVANVVSNGADVAADDTIKGAKKYADEKAAGALTDAKAYADSIVTGTGGISKKVEDLEAKMTTAEADIDALEGKVDVDKVSTAISTAKEEAIAAAGTAADGKVSDLKTELTATIKTAQDTADEAKANVKTADDKAVAAQGDVDALEGLVGALPEGATATTVVGYVDEKIAAIPAQTDYTVTVSSSENNSVAKRYTIAQAATGLSVDIDIPKDMVVKSGTVETNPEGQPAGTYLVLVLANADNDKVYINVGDLIEYVSGAEAADGIITTTVSADHVLTATIGDGKITKAKLEKAVQDSLALADNAVQKETGKSLIADTLIARVEGIEDGAQANIIESVKVAGSALTVAEDKSIDIPAATATALGLIKVDDSTIQSVDGTISVKALSTDKLVAGTEVWTFNCGDASSLG